MIPVHSDPELQLLLQPPEQTYVTEWKEASMYNKSESDSYTDYTMVQPALIVADSSGAVVQKWSWMLLGIENPVAMSTVANPDPNHELKEVRLVTVRPVTADIGPSIAEARPVQLQAMLPPGSESSRIWNPALPEPTFVPADVV